MPYPQLRKVAGDGGYRSTHKISKYNIEKFILVGKNARKCKSNI
jgi:hypothetical protein